MLRSQVQSQSYGARSRLIEAPLKELDLDITPRVGLVRDPSLTEPEPLSEEVADDIVAAFESSKRRLLIVGEPGSGKSMAAYSLIEHLNNTKGGAGRIPLLVNVSAWEAQDSFELFLVDYLCSSVGYQVRQRAVARAFIESRRYSLILDGLDEIPAGLRTHFSERLDEFVRGLPSEVGVVVTCRIQEYEELLAAKPTGLGLVQAVQILPLTDEQLDRAFVELSKRDKDWEQFLSQRTLKAYQRVRNLLSNPLFLNLAVVGHLSPGQLLDFTTTRQELQDLVLQRYIERTLADQRQYEPTHARRYLTWIARFLDGVEVSPYGLKTTDFTVLDFANLTPPEPPRGYRLSAGLVLGLVLGLVFFLVTVALGGLMLDLVWVLDSGLLFGLLLGLIWELCAALLSWWASKRSALSSRLTFVWPSNRRQLLDFLRRAGRGLVLWPVLGLVLAVFTGSFFSGLIFGLIFGLLLGLVDARPVLISARTPTEARSRSLSSALFLGLSTTLFLGLGLTLTGGLGAALFFALPAGLILGLNNGGWFVFLQKVSHRRLARAGNLPPRPYDFLEWGIERQILRRVGSGVRFRHSLIQQHLANVPEDGSLRSSEARRVAAPQSDGSGTPLR